jgi:hypothetical protein
MESIELDIDEDIYKQIEIIAQEDSTTVDAIIEKALTDFFNYLKPIVDRFNTLDKYMENYNPKDFDCPVDEAKENYIKTKQILFLLFYTMQDHNNPLIGYDYYGKCYAEWHRSVKDNQEGNRPKYFKSDVVHVEIEEDSLVITKSNLDDKNISTSKKVLIKDVTPDIMNF